MKLLSTLIAAVFALVTFSAMAADAAAPAAAPAATEAAAPAAKPAKKAHKHKAKKAKKLHQLPKLPSNKFVFNKKAGVLPCFFHLKLTHDLETQHHRRQHLGTRRKIFISGRANRTRFAL